MTDSTHNENKVALVIGASSSIGEAVCTAMLGAHKKVIGSYHSGSLDFEHPDIDPIRLDIADAESRGRCVASLKEHQIRLDSLVILSGAIAGCSLSEYNDDQANRTAAVNFVGQGLMIRDLLPHLAKSATVILVSSIAAERGSFDPFYAASKGAMIPFAKSLATLKGQDITAITILPGPIENSTMFGDMSSETQQSHRQQAPRGRLLQPHELAKVISDMCQPHWRHANGAVIRLNGGAYV